ncbi:MAG: hypothetical protein PHX43_02580, partial [Alphaproteobacteria bacterium]|nr:hypothetical protein [Alphaproteobacteria bacterium]
MAKIDFMGDPAKGESFSKLTRFFSFPDTKAALLATVFTAAAHQITSPESTLSSTAICLSINFLGSAAERLMMRKQTMPKIFPNHEDQKYCINTKPDKNSPPNTDKWGLQAAQMEQFYKMGIKGFCIGSSISIVFSIISLCSTPTLNNCVKMADYFLPCVALLTHILSGA